MGSYAIPPTIPLAIPPLWRLGFRPFFLGGTLFGVAGISLWLAVLMGKVPAWEPLGGWFGWHRHEMPFGFVAAIIAGFLLTAVQNWSGRPGLSGRPLLLLAGSWLAARLCWLSGAPWQLAALPELAFLLALAASAGRSLWQVRQKHNYLAPGSVVLLGLADALSFAGIATGNEAWQHAAAMSAIWLIAGLMTMIGGRVIPFFTQRGLALQTPPASWLWLDAVLMMGALTLAALALAGWGRLPQWPLAFLFGLLAAGHAIRLWNWHRRGIWRIPLLWSLHLACFWMVTAFIGLALFHAGLPIPASLALHALTVGGMGGLILAMMARVSLAHTGRSLTAPKPMAWAFACVNLGTAARVFLLFWFPLVGLVLAALCWMAAFGIFIGYYGPILCRPRVDGLPG